MQRYSINLFSETLTEAKEKAREAGQGNLGRGFRIIKNTTYYSPAEEEQRQKYKETAKSEGIFSMFAFFLNSVLIR